MAEFYLDNSASGANDGSSPTDAWEDFATAKTALDAMLDNGGGNTVIVYEGDTTTYGDFEDHSQVRANWLIFEAAPGETPLFDRVDIDAGAQQDTYIKILGFELSVVDPGLDATDPPWSVTRSPTWDRNVPVIALDNVDYVHIDGCTIHGFNRYSVRYGIIAINCEYVEYKNNEVYHVLGDQFFRVCNHILIEGNHVHTYGGSSVIRIAHTSFVSTELQTDFTIRRNHVHGGVNDPTDDFYPCDVLVDTGSTYSGTWQVGEEITSGTYTGEIIKFLDHAGTMVIWSVPTGDTSSEQDWGTITGTDSSATMDCLTKALADAWLAAEYGQSATNGIHAGSGISISTTVSDITIQQNIIHHHAGQGIYLFEGYDAYEDVLIENNLFYDIGNGNRIRNLLPDTGVPVIIRNNTFVGYKATETLSSGGIIAKYNRGGGPKSTLLLDLNGSAVAGEFQYTNNIVMADKDFPVYDASWIIRNNIWWVSNAFGAQVEQPTHASDLMCVWDTPGYDGYHSFFEDIGSEVGFSAWTTLSPEIGYVFQKFFEALYSRTRWGQPYLRPAADELGTDIGVTNDCSLADGSPGINFGNATYQPTTSLGSLVDGFIQDDGPTRDADRHSIGAYEIAAAVTPANNRFATLNRFVLINRFVTTKRFAVANRF